MILGPLSRTRVLNYFQQHNCHLVSRLEAMEVNLKHHIVLFSSTVCFSHLIMGGRDTWVLGGRHRVGPEWVPGRRAGWKD